jgi:hypothetical protein
MKIHISESTKSFLEKRSYKVVERGKIEIKGKGEMKTYFVLSRFDKRGNEVKCSLMDVFEDMNEKARAHSTEAIENNTDGVKTSELDDVKSIGSRGYSPVTMEDVRKSMTSLKNKSQVNILSPLPLLDEATTRNIVSEKSGKSKSTNSEKIVAEKKNDTKRNENKESSNIASSKNEDSIKTMQLSANKVIARNNEMHEKERNSVKSVRSNATANISLGANIVKRAESNDNKIVQNTPKSRQTIQSYDSDNSLKDKANSTALITPRKPHQQHYADIGE